MKCSVNGAPFDANSVIYRDRGYGTDPGRPLHPYSLLVSDDELLSKFGESFDVFMAQCREDDASFPDSDIPELKPIAYPSLAEMLSLHRPLLSGLLKEFLYFQLLDALLGSNPQAGWRFAVNEIAEVSDEHEAYTIKGSGYFL